MADNAGVLRVVRVDRIVASRYQARKDFNEDGLKSLAESIKGVGLKMPVAVRSISATEALADRPSPNPLPEGASAAGGDEWWELLDGERRWRAHKLAGIEYIPAIEYEIKYEAEAAGWGVVSNLQRADLNPIEEAVGYDNLNKLDSAYWTHEQIAAKFGKSRVYITQSIGMLALPQFIKDNVMRITLSRSHAIQLMRLPAELQENAAKIVISRGLNWRNTTKLVDKILANPAAFNTSPLAGEGGGEGGVANPKPKPVAKGIKCVKSGKGFHFGGGYKTLIPIDDFVKAARDSYQALLDEQAKQAQVQQAKSKAGSSKPDPEALKADKAAKRDATAETARLKKQLKTAQAHFSSLKTGNRDTSGALKDIESIKADIEAQKQKLKAASKHIPSPLAGEGRGEGEHKQTDPAQSLNSGNLNDPAETSKAVSEFRAKMAELIMLQQALKVASSEEEKARLTADIEKKKAEFEAIRKTLNGGGV